jgi:DNA-binding transcriptional LysR family regulator
MNLSDLATFVQVAEHGSFSGAARALGVPKSTVSRRVSRLEDALGIPLLVRSGRAIALTDDGRRLSARSAVALRELADVEQEVKESRGEPRGRLRLTCAPDLARQSRLTDLLAEYRRRWPDVVVEVVLTNRVVDLVEEGFDVALRPNANLLRDAGTIMGRKVFDQSPGLYASREYVARAGVPESPEDLLHHACIAHTLMMKSGLSLMRDDWTEPRLYPVKEAIVVNDFAAITDLVVSGAGISVVFVVDEPLSEELVRVLPRYDVPYFSLWVVWPASRHLSPRVRAFVDLVAEGLIAVRT